MSSSSPTTSRTGSSGAPAELPPGTVVGGFRIERLIGRGSRATVYEAAQPNLGRQVALKVMDDPALGSSVRRLRWPEHPGAVSLYGAGDSEEHGPWIAMRLVHGGTLEDRDAPLDRVADALAAAHTAGIVHGDVTARNVLVEGGRAYLSDFALAPGASSVEGDRAALAELVRRRARRRSRLRARVAAGLVLAVLGAVAVVVVASGGDPPSRSVPPVPDGTRQVGSDLAAGDDVESVDCSGGVPGGASRACTISQLELAGRRVVVPTDGTITSWAVRGARGTLALQTLRGRAGALVEVDRSADEVVSGSSLHVARAQMAVAAGDRIALLVTPEAAIGVRDTDEARTERWFGPLVEPARPPESGAGTGLDAELLLRVDVRPGADVPDLAELRGRSAARAPAGRRVAARDVVLAADGGVRTVAVIVLGGAAAVDLFDGSRRLARAPLRGADGRGRLASVAGRAGELRVRWRNPSGAVIGYGVTVRADSVSPRRRRG